MRDFVTSGISYRLLYFSFAVFQLTEFTEIRFVALVIRELVALFCEKYLSWIEQAKFEELSV